MNGTPDTASRFADSAFLGHPRGLGWLAFSEFWERFCYYGMQVLLVLYMTHQLLQPAASFWLMLAAIVLAAAVILWMVRGFGAHINAVRCPRRCRKRRQSPSALRRWRAGVRPAARP
jgi:hypothetical protein